MAKKLIGELSIPAEYRIYQIGYTEEELNKLANERTQKALEDIENGTY